MIENVMKLYPITEESVLKHATGSKSIFKQHIMRALIEYGYALEFYGDLNDRLFNLKNGTCLVEREYPDVKLIGDFQLNIFNNFAINAYRKLGLSIIDSAQEGMQMAPNQIYNGFDDSLSYNAIQAIQL